MTRSVNVFLDRLLVNVESGSDVNKDLGPKAKAKDLVPEATDPQQA